MSMESIEGVKVPLGVGQIISESFSIFFGNIIKVVALGFIPTLIGLIIAGLLTGFDVALGSAEPDFFAPGAGALFAISTVVQMGIYGVTIALLVQMAYDAKQGKSRKLATYYAPALKAAFPIALLAIVSAILMGIGLLLLVVPGLWIYAVFSVMAPAVVIDKVGFRGLGRSTQLTKEYRWPVLGALIIMLVVTVLLSFAVTFLAGIFASIVGFGAVGVVLTILISGLVYAFTYGLSGITVALIYARLREIKEGVSVEELAAVFD